MSMRAVEHGQLAFRCGLLIRIVNCVSWLPTHSLAPSRCIFVWLRLRLFLGAPLRCNCTHMVVLPPRPVPGSRCCAPRASHQHQCSIPLVLARYSWFSQSHQVTSVSLVTALLFLRRNWQQNTGSVCIAVAGHQSLSIFPKHWAKPHRESCTGLAG